MSASRRPRPVRRAVAVVAVVVSTVVTAGCGALMGTERTPDGVSAPSASDLYAKTRAATLDARSGHVTGFVTQGGQAVTIDLEGRMDGTNQRLRFGEDGRGKGTILTVNGKDYVSGDWDFWAGYLGDARSANAMTGKHVVVPQARLSRMPDLALGSVLQRAFADESIGLVDRFTASVVLRTVDDRDVWVLRGRDGELWVDRESGRLVKVVATGEDPGELTFDRWNRAKRFPAPTSAAVIRS